MATELSIETDIKKAVSFLEELGKSNKAALKRVLTQTTTAAKPSVKKAYKASGLRKNSGALYKSIKGKVFKHGNIAMIWAGARRDESILYGYALAKGATIKAKKKPYLKFQIDGKWISKKEVKLKKHDFVEGPVKGYLRTQAFKDKLDSFIQKEIERAERKAAQK